MNTTAIKKVVLLSAMALVTSNMAKANDVNDDYLLPNKYDSFFVHQNVKDTIIFTEEYGGPTRFTAMTASAKAYVAKLKLNVAYDCSFSGRSAPCTEVKSSQRSCDAVRNEIQFTAVVCSEKR